MAETELQSLIDSGTLRWTASMPGAQQVDGEQAAGDQVVRDPQVAGQQTAGQQAGHWSWPRLQGRVIELVAAEGSAVLSVATDLVLRAQRAGEPVVWLGGGAASFFPPDVAACGVDLENLAVVRLAEPRSLLRAVDQLLRSGGFGLAVVDAGDAAVSALTPLGAQARLVGLAKQHGAAVAWLSREGRGRGAGPGSFASLRVECSRRRIDDGVFECVIAAVKDKRGASGLWQHSFVCDGTPGLR